VDDDSDYKAVLLSGYTDAGYEWDALIEAKAGSEMIRFFLTCHLKPDLNFSAGLMVGSWMDKPSAELIVEQGPMSIYRYYCPGFPTAYVWDEGKEATVFFDMNPAT